ncbi:pyridoxamine 5'-phosphate oxidase family protein [Burkholderia cenocepacia]|uniref:Pyridoxamine 5'-phosphate oxidase family protein n=2 Tax=Burkholderia TaxID=32008 RepID=A0AAW4TNS9_9BURK|nr:pyridoxamine 5'-phosphate oxidase family protein [Burkholderia cenocepacia]MCA8383365.1 pyridoxamine 5'-phosphate oxidase family protein [Burkholderia cenocepacia]
MRPVFGISTVRGGVRPAHARRAAWHVACMRITNPHATAHAPTDTMNDRGPLTDDAIAFIREQAFLIVATADAAGNSDCSYRGRQPRADGSFTPLVDIPDRRTLVLPDFAGNHLLNTIGNLLVNPAIALLFVDFVRQTTWLVQGRATLDEDAQGRAHLWPDALRYLVIEVERAEARADAGLPPLVLA